MGIAISAVGSRFFFLFFFFKFKINKILINLQPPVTIMFFIISSHNIKYQLTNILNITSDSNQ